MWNFLLYGPRRDQAGDPDASGQTATDPGTPFVHGEKPESKPAKTEKSDTDKRIEALERDLVAERKRSGELSASEQYWANKARGAAPEKPEPKPEVKPEPRRREPAAEKPEKFLDDVSTEGLGALLKRGVITVDQLDDLLKEREDKLRLELRSEIAGATTDAAFQNSFQSEFPEIIADNRKVDAWKKGGERPADRPEVSELSSRTSEIFREMVAEDPELGKSQGTLINAARMAKRLIAAEGKGRDAVNNRDDERQRSRRDRIDDQRGPRGAGGGDDEPTTRMSGAARTIIGHLKDFGATEDGYTGQFSKDGLGGRSRK